MTGDDSAARLAPEPRGRAVLQRDGTVHELQVAMSAPQDAVHVSAGHAGIRDRPWLDPLPATIPLGDVPSPGGPGRVFGVLDLPAEQRQPPAVYDPERHGHLLVLGAAGAGASTALAAVSAGAAALVLSAEPADAWAQLEVAHGHVLLVIDGLDALLAAAGSYLGHELGERIAALLRGRTPAVAASARRLGGPVAGLAGLFGSRLLLRQSSRDEHLLAGGAAETWDPALPPGAGTWRGDVVQVATAGIPLPSPEVPPLPRVVPGADRVLAVVAARPGELALPPGVRVVAVGRDGVPGIHADEGGRPTVLLGDPDAWQSEWTLLTEARRGIPIVLIGCTAADHRLLLREAQPPPPLGARHGQCWLSRGGRTVRAVWEAASTPESEEFHRVNR
jgi:S-DNA-T family DNA segregation ATPase FtsK/SpoIIIE